MERPNKKFAGLSKKQKFKRITDILFKSFLIATLCSVVALCLYICLKSDDIQEAHAESASVYSLNDSTVNYFNGLWTELALGPSYVGNEGFVFLSGLPQYFDGQGYIFPSNEPFSPSMDSVSYYSVDTLLEFPYRPDNVYSNIFCVGTPTSAMDGNSNDMIMTFIDEFSDGSYLTTYYFFRNFSRSSGGSYFSNYSTLYTWTEDGSVTLDQVKSIRSGGVAGILASRPYLQPRTIGSYVGSDLTYIVHPARSNVVSRQIYAYYRIDYAFGFFDYSLYGGDSITSTIVSAINENAYNNATFFGGVESSGGSGGVSQERYDSLLQAYNLVLDQRDEWQRKFTEVSSQYQSVYQDFLRVDSLLADEKYLNGQLIISRDGYKADYEKYFALYNEYFEKSIGFENQIIDLEDQILDLNSSLSEKDSDISSLESDITDLQGQVASVSSELSTLQGSYAGLQSMYNQLKTDYDILNNDVDLETKLKEKYNQGYADAVKNGEAALDIWENIPKSVVTIWNGPMKDILTFDIAGFNLFEFLCGAFVFIFAFWILGKFI